MEKNTFSHKRDQKEAGSEEEDSCEDLVSLLHSTPQLNTPVDLLREITIDTPITVETPVDTPNILVDSPIIPAIKDLFPLSLRIMSLGPPIKHFSGEKDQDVRSFLELLELNALHDASGVSSEVEKDEKDTFEKALKELALKSLPDNDEEDEEIEEALDAYATLEQGERDDEDYYRFTKELAPILGPYEKQLGRKFVQGIRDPVVRKVVTGNLSKSYKIDEALVQFFKIMRGRKVGKKTTGIQEAKTGNSEMEK
ncbi:hypothetical protein DFH27DRAFT_610132 [Peziza echinospora]|nr:hypothetical protein DFH27DRAFT_610132 [Peziza echinospora]